MPQWYRGAMHALRCKVPAIDRAGFARSKQGGGGDWLKYLAGHDSHAAYYKIGSVQGSVGLAA